MTDATAVHARPNADAAPVGELCTRTLAMPADTNQNGDIFGGWLLSKMDIGGGVFASKLAKSRTVTVVIDAMNFRKRSTSAISFPCMPRWSALAGPRSRCIWKPGDAPQGEAVYPRHRRQIYLRRDRR